MLNSATFLVAFSLWFVATTNGIEDPSLPPGLFYPFGADEGDNIVPVGMTSFAELHLEQAIAFKTEFYTKLIVETHGLVTFGHRYSDFTPQPFPILGDNKAFLAPYWAGADTSLNNGKVYYRDTSDNDLLERARVDIQRELGATADLGSFVPKRLFIATWHKVTFSRYGTTTSPVNSFQAILAWTAKRSATMFRYGELKWTTGGFSGGNANGLGGVPAEMGFNSGSSGFYFKHNDSLTTNILHLANNTNVGVMGHYAFRTDINAEAQSSCFENDEESVCPFPWYRQTDVGCEEYYPSFDCPELQGPFERIVTRGHREFDFHCNVFSNETREDSLFEITFLFGGVFDSAVRNSRQTNLTSGQRATLQSEDLRGRRKMGTTISCQVRSFFSSDREDLSESWKSNDYYMGIVFEVNGQISSRVDITENETNPRTIMLKSTVPVTCSSNAVSSSEQCSLDLKYNVINDGNERSIMVFRQRYENLDPVTHRCSYIMKEGDWKPEEQRAYNAPLEVFARLDHFVTGPRRAWLTFSFNSTNQSIWYGYESSPAIQLYHHDVPNPFVRCSADGDPRMKTFDGLWYSTHCNGKLDYARSAINTLGFEIQVRHCPCDGSRSSASCVCGIAIREDKMILIADTCNGRKIPQYSAINDFPDCVNFDSQNQTCGIFASNTEFKLVVPSGNRVYGRLISGNRIDVEIVISSRDQSVTGLCGSPDGNFQNDWTFGNNGTIYNPRTWSSPPRSLVYSWRHNLSLFDVPPTSNADLPNLDANDPRQVNNFCECTGTVARCRGTTITDPIWPNDPKITVLSSSSDALLPDDQSCGTGYLSPSCTETSFRVKPRDGITEAEANATCWNRIMDVRNLGTTCMEIMLNDTETAGSLVYQCALDLMETGEDSWADEKIRVVQKYCYYDIMNKNNSELNDTTEAIEMVLTDLQAVTDYMCNPFNCNEQGECVNGTCICEEDYIGSDCSVSKSAVPVIHQLLSNGLTDIRNGASEGVSLLVSDTADVPTMSCSFETQLLNDLHRTYSIRGAVTSPSTVVCALPSEALIYTSKYLPFTALHGPGFNFSCLSTGSPAIHFILSITNDGQNYSNSVEFELFDSQCIDCSSGTCVQVPNSCMINGYCFADQQLNPYMEGCEVCDPAFSENSWTKTSSDDSCPTVWDCADGGKCVPNLDFTYTCELDACESSPCLNGGTCINGGTRFDCTCPPSHTGVLCESALPTPPTTTSTSTMTTSITPSTTTTGKLNYCGNIMHHAENATLPGGWHLGCYIGQGDEAHWTTLCSELLDGLPNYGSAEELLAAGGNFGCYITETPITDDVYNACLDNYQHGIFITLCRTCNFLGACIRLPTA